MKNIFLILSSIVFVTAGSFVQAQTKKAAAAPAKFSRPYGMAGCGLGSQLFEKNSGQVFAATTNGSSYTNLFGITSGTSNCEDGPNTEVASRLDRFIVANKVALNIDIARGQGETLASMTTLMGCSSASPQVGQALKANYNSIFTDVSVPANAITDSIIDTLLKDKEIAGQCSLS